ncbi:hypothetical protein DSECCO2_413270 [anaerobic digester metagenome]
MFEELLKHPLDQGRDDVSCDLAREFRLIPPLGNLDHRLDLLFYSNFEQLRDLHSDPS